MPKKKADKRQRDPSLCPDFTSVEYPATDNMTSFPVRGGARRPSSAEVRATQPSPAQTRKGR